MDILTIGIVSISSVLNQDAFVAGTNILADAGFRVKVAPNVAQCRMVPPEERARLLEEMWLDPEVDLLLFSRGGEGAEEVVPLLDWDRLRARPDMPVMGFSDVTILLNAMLAKGVGHPISGPMLSYATRLTPEAREWTRGVLRGALGNTAIPDNAGTIGNTGNTAGGLPPVSLTQFKGVTAADFKPEGRLPDGEAALNGAGAVSAAGSMGGHVTRLHWLFQNGLAPSAAGRVVFLECTARHKAETVIADLTEMRKGGFFDGAAAVVLCDFRHKDAERAALDAFFAEFAADLPCPVFAGFPYGHVSEIRAIDFRREVIISPDGALRF